MTAASSRRARRLICLVGFMGCGKTTVGRRLAQRLGWYFVDLDAEIVRRAGTNITRIFQEKGEPAFRELEHEVLRRVLGRAQETEQSLVLALGGGTIAQERNLQLVRAAEATLIWLDCPVEELLKRCAGVNDRPLFRDEDSFRKLYAQRLPYYQQADYRVDSTATQDEIVERIVALDLIERVR
jgi:shikimate kinase